MHGIMWISQRMPLVSVVVLALSTATWAQQSAGSRQESETPDEGREQRFDSATTRRLPPPDAQRFPGLKRLSEGHDVWIDREGGRVVLQAAVCQRNGPLELFACIHRLEESKDPQRGLVRIGTKEYESVVTINTTAALVHTALLAIGAQSGSPARFRPTYQPASGSTIEVRLHWTDAQGRRREAQAQDWIRHVKSSEALTHRWVFAGSGFSQDGQGRQHYLGEEGNLICISNFTDAVMDLPIHSPEDNSQLLFETFTERIPPMGTVVTVVLKPIVDITARRRTIPR